MTPHPLLIENENKRLDLPLPMLVCFAMFTVWEMGVGYFSGEALSLGGRVPLPVSIDNVTLLAAAAYIVGILFLIFFQRYCVLAARALISIALVSMLGFYIPFAPGTLAVLYYVHYFCGVFTISVLIATVVNLFTEKTELRNFLVNVIIAGILIAFLHNDFVPVSFDVFLGVTVISLAMLLIFFCKMPAKIWPQYIKKPNGLVKPKRLFAGLFALITLSTLMTLFGLAVAESTANGVTINYIFFAVGGIIIAVLWKYRNISPLRSASILLMLSALGFIFAIVSFYLPVFSLAACAFLGLGLTISWLSSYFGVVMARRYPSRYISPLLILIGLLTVLIHSWLLESFRNNLQILYIIYLVIAVTFTLIYLSLQPYLLYSYRSRTLQDIIGVIAEEADEGESDPMLQAVKPRQPLLRTAPKTDPAPLAAQLPAQEEPLHARRMKMLMKHALSPLTKREYQAADGIMRGLRRAEIAQEMGVLPESVTKYTNRIYDKFGIHRRQDLFRLAETLDREWGEEEPHTKTQRH